MDSLDRKIITATQSGLPLVSEPYKALAQALGISSEILMQRLQVMQTQGIIRRIAAVPNHYKLGYTHNGMTVWDVDEQQIDRLGAEIGAFEFVSHCYHRPRHLPNWPYNLFAMVHGKTRETTVQQIKVIADHLGNTCQAHEVLYSRRILKKTGLRLK